jgi:phosphatidylglycerol:prolipoprotein diacylglycerol transferase
MTKEILFNIGKFPVPSYSFFVLLGLIAGCFTFYLLSKKSKIERDNLLYIFFWGLIGGVLGAKIPVWIINFNQIILLRGTDLLIAIASGRTLVGGLIGGFLAVEYMKKKLKVKQKTGDFFAPAIAIGISIGRIGCFLRGCCGGIKTNLPWAIEGRHPTQLYESLFHFIAFVIMITNMKKYNKSIKRKKSFLKQGDMFKFYILTYAIFRFFTEFLRADEIMSGLLSIAQWVCLATILVISIIFLKRFIKFRRLK